MTDFKLFCDVKKVRIENEKRHATLKISLKLTEVENAVTSDVEVLTEEKARNCLYE